MLPSLLALGAVILVAGLAVRSVWKGRKSHSCGGDCSGCKGCH